MKIERTSNSVKGIISGLINKIILLLLPFLVKSVFINTLGIQYFGLNGLFSSILNILNLAELGVGSAISFSMYSAIASNDEQRICSLIKLYKRTYFIIGCFVFIIGLCICPFIKYICKYDVPNDINIYIIYFMYLLNSVFSYWLYSYKICILVSHQKSYVINNINSLVNFFLYVFQIIVIIYFKNYYFYLSLLIISTILYNILISLYVSKKYKNYLPKGEISKKEKNKIYNKIKALFCYKIGSVVLSSVDSIVISYYLGLTVLGKYNSYYYVITALFGFFQVFTNSLLAGVGNSIEIESSEKNKQDFDKLNFILGWIVGFCSICLLCLYQQFINIWIGSDYLFDIKVVICFAIYFYVWKLLEVVNLYKDAAGLWEYDKYRPLIASFVNLILNIILVKIIGIYGILISTIISIVFVIFPWSSLILFKKYFRNGFKNYIIRTFSNTIITVIIGFITYGLCSLFAKFNLLNFAIQIVICIIIPNLLFYLFYHKDKLFKESYMWISNKIKMLKNK